MITYLAGLWVDDTRLLPKDLWDAGWFACTTYSEALAALEMYNFKEISLDHDLGDFTNGEERTGYHIALWLAQRKMDGHYVPEKIYCHSANPVGRKNIESVVARYLTQEK